MELLPGIIEDILSRLPVKPLVRFRCVSKHWLSLLTTDPIFVRKHLIRTMQNDENHSVILRMIGKNEFYSVPNGKFENTTMLNASYIGDNMQIVGCSNGLICLEHLTDSSLYVWNPATREYKILPDPLIETQPGRATAVALGFSFHPGINDFRVVRLVQVENLDKPLGGRQAAELYSINTNSWKKLGGILPYGALPYSSRAIAKGVVYWMGNTGLPFFKFTERFILSFDMGEEAFRALPMPDSLAEDVNKLLIGTFRGCLSLFVIDTKNDMDVWMMKEYGVIEPWTKVFTVEYNHINTHYYPVEFMKNGELLLRMYDSERNCSDWTKWNLGAYNIESEQVKEVQIPGIDLTVALDAVHYAESLVPLKSTDA